MLYNKTKLENGLKIITVPMADNPAVTVLVMVETGSKYEKEEEGGLAHFIEHMVFKGTPRRPSALLISSELESLGAQYNAFTSQEFTGYYAKVRAEYLDQALDIVSDMFLNPLFENSEIEKEKGVIVEEIRMYKDLPHRHIYDIFMRLVYGNQPAGREITGTEQTVKSFSRENFLSYRKEHYVASATSVIISGSFKEEEIVEKIQKYFKDIPSLPKTPKPPVIESQEDPRLALEFKKTDQAHIVLGFRSFDVHSEYDTAIRVLACLLGKGMSSRLFQKLREEMGVGYYVYASHDTYTDHGLFTLATGIDTSRIDEVIPVLLSECKKIIDEPITEAELRKVKDYMSGSFVLALETSDARAEHFASQDILKGKLESPEQEIAEIEKVTVNDIKKVARLIFKNAGLNCAIIGPYEDRERFAKLLKL